LQKAISADPTITKAKSSQNSKVPPITYTQNEGDTLYFSSEQAHRWRNTGSEEAVLLWLNTAATFQVSIRARLTASGHPFIRQ